MSYKRRRTQRTTYAQVRPTGRMSVKVKHREYLADIEMSSEFSPVEFEINAGLGGSFPWLAQFARNFSQYTFHKLQFEFISSTGDHSAATTPALGVVIMATTLDAHDNDFANKHQMENREGAISACPNQSFIHEVDCEHHGKLYTREQSAPIGQDARLFDVGAFTIATQGGDVSTDYTCGELYVSYVAEFFRPEIPLSMATPWMAHLIADPGTSALPMAAHTYAQAVRYDTIGLDMTNVGTIAPTLQWPAGREGFYRIIYHSTQIAGPITLVVGNHWSFPAMASGLPNGCDLAVDATLSLNGLGQFNSLCPSAAAAASDHCVIQAVIYCNGTPGQLRIDGTGGTWGGGGTSITILPLRAF